MRISEQDLETLHLGIVINRFICWMAQFGKQFRSCFIEENAGRIVFSRTRETFREMYSQFTGLPYNPQYYEDNYGVIDTERGEMLKF